MNETTAPTGPTPDGDAPPTDATMRESAAAIREFTDGFERDKTERENIDRRQRQIIKTLRRNAHAFVVAVCVGAFALAAVAAALIGFGFRITDNTNTIKSVQAAGVQRGKDILRNSVENRVTRGEIHITRAEVTCIYQVLINPTSLPRAGVAAALEDCLTAKVGAKAAAEVIAP